ncbi:hypothetical protein FQN54_008039 [Arachnomyces sp. PD_36]|nr:hypothetical protein FQN54_008039 [Arachnomyces sp. PD_36]
MTLSSVFVAACALFSTAQAVKPLIADGVQFVNSESNERFQIVGIDYQPGGSSGYDGETGKDPLSDKEICLRDAILMQRLGVNTIRVYNLNPETNHDDCASIFNAAGIYMILDVNGPAGGESLNREDPVSTYHEGYLERIFGVVEGFKNYPNTLGFFGGNEVINEDSVKAVPDYLRAVNRDLKQYIKNHSPRPIPVGYSAADVRPMLADTWLYMTCDNGDSPSSQAEFFGLNSYSWCGDASYKSSGYDKLVEQFKDAAQPVFFSEYGCNEVQPRIFTEVQSLYGKEMLPVLSGGLIYEYSQETSDYGVVTLNDNGTVTLLTDYDNLLEQYGKMDTSLLSTKPAKTSSKAPKCDSSLVKSSKFPSKFNVPELPEGGEDLIKNGIPNPTSGKLVEVSDTKMPSTVYDTDGNAMEGLELKILSDDKSNLPGENTSGKSSGSPDGGDDEEDAASIGGVNMLGLVSASAVALLVSSLW